MKTLGFGLKSLLKDPQWAQMHNINPTKQTAGSVVGDNKTDGAAKLDGSIFDRGKKGDIGNLNNIFAQSKTGGAANNKTDIFAMMNKFDEQHKSIMGAQGVQPTHQVDSMNAFGSDEIQKRLGKKISIFM